MESLEITGTAKCSNGNANVDEKEAKPFAASTATALPVIPTTNSFRFNFTIETD